MEPHKLKYARVLLGLYILFLLWLLFFRERQELLLPYWQHTAAHFNPVPFRTVRRYLRLLTLRGRHGLHRIAAANLAGNILLLIPLGWLIPTVFPNLQTFRKTMLVIIPAIAAVEAAQALLLVGTCDMDDLILNAAGAALGYGLYKFFPSASK